MVLKKLFAIVLTVTIVCALLPKVNSQELEAANEMNMNMNMKKRHSSENDLIEDAGDLSEESQFFSPKECIAICESNFRLKSNYCNCQKVSALLNIYKSHGQFRQEKRHYSIDCQVLCFIGQGGKACNCNYAPFVGRK